MGKASRGKKQRNRDTADAWSAAKAARTANQARVDTRNLLRDNMWVHTMLASDVNNRMGELKAVLSHSNVPEQHRENLAFAMMIGEQGWKPPWPPGPAQAARWQTQQVLQLLAQAEVLVISPAAHAAVMAAASTLEAADVATLDKDRDILIPTGVLVLPEPVIVENRGGSLSDIRAFGWQPVTQHQVLPDAQYPGIQLTCFMDRDGPVQPESWRTVVAQARATGSPLPPLVPDGIYGLRADGALSAASREQHASLSEEHRSLNTALNQVAEYNAVPPERVNGTADGSPTHTTTSRPATHSHSGAWPPKGSLSSDLPESPARTLPKRGPVRAVLTRTCAHSAGLQIPAQRSAEDEGSSRAYQHRWTVRMHKVRQCSSPAVRDWKAGTRTPLPRNGFPAATERSASWGCSSPSPSWSASCMP
ncbi:hypothetical protein [Streptomyces sp. NPDC058613]|uniref:hypothetical protein n=1 Tax=Streptomyces sp. NPDC058613 TaxID=3346556 RepID=UPI00365591D1